jgi:hypothetical protein
VELQDIQLRSGKVIHKNKEYPIIIEEYLDEVAHNQENNYVIIKQTSRNLELSQSSNSPTY